MKRIHWFEIMDFDWFPSFLRDIITDTIKVSDKSTMFDRIVPVILTAMEKSGTHNVVDLCSGGGGPWFRLFGLIEEQVPDFSLTFTDLFPNKKTVDKLPKDFRDKIDYIMEPVDATDVPGSLEGVRTFFGSFHHMRPEQAQKILQDAADKKTGIVVGEASIFPRKKAWMILILQIIFFPFYLLMYWLMALKAIKGNIFTIIGRILFVYLIPIVPLVMMWDSAVSAMRVYMKEDLQELISNIETEGYEFIAEEIPAFRSDPAIQYCIGYPTEK